MLSLNDLRTPALVVERHDLEFNIATMRAALPGPRLRPHVKAHKCTALARLQHDAGHTAFTCATIREMEGMAAAGLGADLLLANEVTDASRLDALVAQGHHVTVAVDSEQTINAVALAGVHEVLIDIDVRLPRCGVEPEAGAQLAEYARARGLGVRGVMGYEGHLQGLTSRDERAAGCAESVAVLKHAHDLIGGEIVSAGGTGTFDLNAVATEIQAGSYVLMDTAYAQQGHPFRQALAVLATVISVSAKGWAVADCGLKALGMDHGNSTIDGATVLFHADEHVVFVPDSPVRVGDRIRVWPAHVDPTVAYHEQMALVDGEHVLEQWSIDLRGW